MSHPLTGIKTVKELEIEKKVVFLRLDLNVPLTKDGVISDENRILAALPTIEHCLSRGAKLVIASHLGRPKKGNPTDRVQLSLEPVCARLTELTGKEVLLIDDPEDDSVKGMLKNLREDQMICLENLRFTEKEEANSTEFAQVLASYTDVYVNDAFGASHRAHASIAALPNLIAQKGVGFLIEKELNVLYKVQEQPKAPFVMILGGSKVSDKIPLIDRLIDKVDSFLIGGAMAYTFLKAKGIPVGKSLVEESQISFARHFFERMEARGKKILLPLDHLTAPNLEAGATLTQTSSDAIRDDSLGVDIGPLSVTHFSRVIAEAGTIFWNGPMGIFEREGCSKGTFGIARAVAESKGFSVIGGGDSASAVEMSGYKDKVDHISTGGGASLEYLQGTKLPGLAAVRAPKRSEVL